MVSVETSASTIDRPLREVRNGFMVATSTPFNNSVLVVTLVSDVYKYSH